MTVYLTVMQLVWLAVVVLAIANLIAEARLRYWQWRVRRAIAERERLNHR